MYLSCIKVILSTNKISCFKYKDKQKNVYNINKTYNFFFSERVNHIKPLHVLNWGAYTVPGSKGIQLLVKHMF